MYCLYILRIFTIFLFISHVSAGPYDGSYNAKFAFKMSAQSVCPKELPIDIQIEIKNNLVTGYIFNQGNPENSHKFCELYHNGDISGEVDDTGNIVKLKIKQKSSHSRQYSSYKIKGTLDGDSTLISRSAQYHPSFKFRWVKVEDEQENAVSNGDVVKKVKVEKVELNVKSEINQKDNAEKNEIVAENNFKDKDKVLKNTQTSKKSNQLKDIVSKVSNSDEALIELNSILRQVEMYIVIKENILTNKKISRKERVLSIVDKEIDRLKNLAESLQQNFSDKYTTPIRPKNINLNVSSFRASEIYPKIPYYVPGTSEIGEMLIIPRVTDDGFLVYKLDFVDPASRVDQIRDTMNVYHQSAQDMIKALNKIDEWTTVAQEQGISGRRISKTATCFPKEQCKEKRQGNTSTEVLFQVYEDGSTSGKIQRNKGRFSVGYNFSVESAILLSGYLDYMVNVGSKEFRLGTMSDEEIENLFQ